ncbi:hypothetical protein L7F22_009726 [Adiantum nelumboides]|nr:hypothetical protein [Adiantum nelumboides]
MPVDPRAGLGLPPAPARRRAGMGHARRAAGDRGLRAAGAGHPARDRPPRRRAVRRPPRRRDPQAGHARDPRRLLVRRAGADGQGQPAPVVRQGSMRLLFAAPRPGGAVAAGAAGAPRPRGRRGADPPGRPAGRGRRLTRSPVGELADAAGIPVLTPAKPSDPEFLDTLRALAPDCAPVVATGRCCPPGVDVPVSRLGQPALLAAARLARRGPGAVRDPARRRRHRRHHVPARGGHGHRADLRPGHRDRRRDRHRGRPAGQARRVRCPAARRHPGRHRRRHADRRPAALRGRLDGAEGHHRRRPRRLHHRPPRWTG